MQPGAADPPLGRHVGAGRLLPAPGRRTGLRGSVPVPEAGGTPAQLRRHQRGGQQGVLSGEGPGEDGRRVVGRRVHPAGLSGDGHLHPVVRGGGPAAAGRPHREDANHERLTLHQAL